MPIDTSIYSVERTTCMAMLTRYQKAGGFIQIVQLIETCGKQKQDNFLQMIEAEDPRWASAIREKMLTIEKIFAWENSVLNEVAGRLQQLTLATAMHGLKPEENERLLSTYSHSQRRNVEDLFKTKAPTPAEISSAYIKILQEVRSMITNGYLRVEKFAPELAIPEGFEDKLGKSIFQPNIESSNEPTSFAAASESAAPPAHSSKTHTSNAHASSHSDAETNALRSRLQLLQNENTQLKSELRIFKEKIAQIKKIA